MEEGTTTYLTLFDWLQNRKSDALIVYPRMMDRWNVVTHLLADLRIYSIAVVSENPSLLRETAGRSASDVSIVSYMDIRGINRIINGSGADIVIFDSAPQLSMILPALSLPQNMIPKIIVLTTWGDGDSVHEVVKAFPSLGLLSADFMDEAPHLRWHVIKVSMSAPHREQYDITLDQERANNSTMFPLSRMIGSYRYPSTIHSPTAGKNNEYPDLPVKEGGWITPDHMKSLATDGAKMYALISNLTNIPGKHVVLTLYSSRYGQDMISTFLSMNNIPVIVGESPMSEKVEQFNAMENGVFVTTLIPCSELRGVSAIHIPDNYNVDSFRALLQHVYKQKCMSPNDCALNVYLYANTSPSEGRGISGATRSITVDEALLTKFSQKIDQFDELYDRLLIGSSRIIFTSDFGLVVTENSGKND